MLMEDGVFCTAMSKLDDYSVAGGVVTSAIEPCRVVIGEAHFMMRAGIRALLEESGMEVAAEANDAPGILGQVHRLQPDVAILEPRLDEGGAYTLITSVRDRAPRTKILVLSDVTGAEAIRAAFDAGASAYIAKDDDVSDLPSVLRAILHGRTYVSQRVSQSLVESGAGGSVPGSRRTILTARQTEIVRLIARGESTLSISKSLGITPRTVYTHRSRIMQRLDVHTEGALVYSAFKLGIVAV